jgi:hypothetical protein
VKFERTPRFDTDYKALPREHRAQFKALIKDFNVACAGYLEGPGRYVWPAGLPVRPMTSAPGIWEITWSLARPDGRATFEFVTSGNAARVRWRRIGDHGI